MPKKKKVFLKMPHLFEIDMDLLEYQGKRLFQDNGLKCPEGFVISSTDELEGHDIVFPVVVKIQVPIGKRGKGGGITFVEDEKGLHSCINELLGSTFSGHVVERVLIEQKVAIKDELYLAVTLDVVNESPVLIISSEGGMDIEQVARDTPEKVQKVYIDPIYGLSGYSIRTALKRLRLDNPELLKWGLVLYGIFLSTDAQLVEVNPLVITKDGEVVAVDSKVSIDDNAAFRQKALLEGMGTSFNYVPLDGNLGVIGNGAGLVMSTIDTLVGLGGKPANFLDIGGGADKDRMREAIGLVAQNPKVETILINIFGGITRCDEVAMGVLSAIESLESIPSLIVRLEGTNKEEGRRLLEENGVVVVEDPEDAIRLSIGGEV